MSYYQQQQHFQLTLNQIHQSLSTIIYYLAQELIQKQQAIQIQQETLYSLIMQQIRNHQTEIQQILILVRIMNEIDSYQYILDSAVLLQENAEQIEACCGNINILNPQLKSQINQIIILYIYRILASLCYASKYLPTLYSLYDFRQTLTYYFGYDIAQGTDVDVQIIVLFEDFHPYHQRTIIFVNQFCQQYNITMQYFNQSGHQYQYSDQQRISYEHKHKHKHKHYKHHQKQEEDVSTNPYNQQQYPQQFHHSQSMPITIQQSAQYPCQNPNLPQEQYCTNYMNQSMPQHQQQQQYPQQYLQQYHQQYPQHQYNQQYYPNQYQYPFQQQQYPKYQSSSQQQYQSQQQYPYQQQYQSQQCEQSQIPQQQQSQDDQQQQTQTQTQTQSSQQYQQDQLVNQSHQNQYSIKSNPVQYANTQFERQYSKPIYEADYLTYQNQLIYPNDYPIQQVEYSHNPEQEFADLQEIYNPMLDTQKEEYQEKRMEKQKLIINNIYSKHPDLVEDQWDDANIQMIQQEQNELIETLKLKKEQVNLLYVIYYSQEILESQIEGDLQIQKELAQFKYNPDENIVLPNLPRPPRVKQNKEDEDLSPDMRSLKILQRYLREKRSQGGSKVTMEIVGELQEGLKQIIQVI